MSHATAQDLGDGYAEEEAVLDALFQNIKLPSAVCSKIVLPSKQAKLCFVQQEKFPRHSGTSKQTNSRALQGLVA